MGSSEDRLYDANKPKRRPDPVNPFVAFKRFADEQFSSLLNKAFGSNPSILNPAVSYETFKQDYENRLQKCRGSETRLELERSDPSQCRLLEEQRDVEENRQKCPSHYPATRTLTDGETSALCSFDIQASNARLANPFQRSSRDQSIQRPAIPLFYMIAGPYSPLSLGLHTPEFSRTATNLRAAFEDLVRLENGLPMSDHPPSAANSAEDTCEWIKCVLNMIEAGEEKLQHGPIGHKPFPSLHTTQSPFADQITASETRDADGNGPRSNDVDVLHAAMRVLVSTGASRHLFLDRAGRAEADRNSAHMSNTNNRDAEDDLEVENFHIEDEDDNDKMEEEEVAESDMIALLIECELEDPPASVIVEQARRQTSCTRNLERGTPSVLSSLTTTKKTTLADGTVHTKLVLKKRFSDGREESTETQHTENTLHERPKTSISAAAKAQDSDNDRNTRTKKGWFWN